ncbi:MAG TPA: ComF family protein [Caldimonas sp.]
MPAARPLRARPGGRLAAAAMRWPSLCAVCEGWGLGRVCADCRERFAPLVPRCRRCALQVPAGIEVCGECLAAPPPFDAAFARVDYAYPWDRLIPAFKFHAALDLTTVFVAAMLEAGAGRAIDASESLVVPVPLSDARLRERGFNQAWELARRLAPRIGGRAESSLLVRLRETAHQIALPPDERAGNVRDAFAVEPRRRGEIRGRTVALIDDVMTTGSTAAEIARVLRHAGAARIEVWVVARTPRPGDR